MENEIMELKKQKEQADKELLRLEWVISYISLIAFFSIIFIASLIEMESALRIVLICIGSVIFAIGMCNAIRIEQIAGYYECKKCHNKYVPKYMSVLFAPHIGRTRYMKCPECNKKSWNKKVLSK